MKKMNTKQGLFYSSLLRLSAMLVVHAVFPINSERRDEAVELIQALADQSREEEGVIDYQVATDIDDQDLFRFFEQYEGEAAFEAHTNTDHFEEFEAKLPDLLGGEPVVTRYDVASESEVEL